MNLDRSWISQAASTIAEHAERELEALVGISTPSGDAAGAEEAVALCAALLPLEVAIERIECSSPDHAPDLLARVSGTGAKRILLLGHLDTVVAHGEHRPLEREGERLVGSGTVDMKGGIVLALGLLRALAGAADSFAEIALLAVNDEEWRTGPLAHSPLFEGYDACLCFEGGQLGPNGEEAVVVRRKAAGTLRVSAQGVAAHSGAAPELGRNALLALAEAARRVDALSDPDGPRRLTAIPTVLRSGEAFNVVPAAGELICDLRANSLDAFGPVLEAVPAEHEGVRLNAELVRRWPGMDTTEPATPVLGAAAELLGRAVIAAERGGASDASHLAGHVPLTLDGLGPLGGAAHNPDEFILRESLRTRAEVALALAAAVLAER
ncbi:MAG TPA: M20/M25/M40 family metallo-hydrolase [Solirubrobacterales bacterium]|nr:M20/M25/M40 family metallo-hydrolase [Solirubrobacterales bacterium]